MLTVGSLFSGIGGFDLGLERTGHMQTLWFCEQDPYCQRVLARHWPGVPCHPDVRALVADPDEQLWRSNDGAIRGAEGAGQVTPLRTRPATDGSAGQMPVPVPYVDVLCGGFPCQDLSVAGKGAGLDGERSGLWSEYARLIGELRPRYVIVENVPALLARGFGRVLGDLAACGYDAEWDCLPASAFGAPHRRDRVWVVAYPAGGRGERRRPESSAEDGGRALGLPARSGGESGAGNVADPDATGRSERRGSVADETQHASAQRSGQVEDPERAGLARRERGAPTGARAASRPQRSGQFFDDHWTTEPNVGRVAHGVPSRVDRLSALGNALLPQIAEWIGRRIMSWESQ